MIRNATRNQLLAIVDVCANILRKNFLLTHRQEKSLEKYADYMRKLNRARNEASAKEVIQQGEGIPRAFYNARLQKRQYRLSKQRGRGFLPALLIPVLAELAEHMVEKFLQEPPAAA